MIGAVTHNYSYTGGPPNPDPDPDDHDDHDEPDDGGCDTGSANGKSNDIGRIGTDATGSHPIAITKKTTNANSFILFALELIWHNFTKSDSNLIHMNTATIFIPEPNVINKNMFH